MDGKKDQAVQAAPSHRRWWQRRWFKIVASLAVACCLVLIISVEYILHNAEPIIRKRIIETLSARYDAPVQLDRLSISLIKGVEVEGWGLRIPYGAGYTPQLPQHPLIAVRYFSFRTSIRDLLRQPTHIANVRVEGMELHIPPPSERALLLGGNQGHKPATPGDAGKKLRISVIADNLECQDVKLSIHSDKPGPDHGFKPPLEFDIANLHLRRVGAHQAMLYDAQLTNPKPIGMIHAVGHFGPWGGSWDDTGQAPDPGQTPVDGDYSFSHADLSTIKGIGGTLSSTGHFSGVLNRILIDGTTDTPDFSLDISNRPVPLHTRFHAIVDGINGDTDLAPVYAHLENSDFTTTGKIVKVLGSGHEILLDVDVPHGRMQDFLRLAAKTNPPLMDGSLAMHARLDIPPGHERVPLKLSMGGSFTLTGVQFNNPHLQNRIDGLSARAQGQPKEVKIVSHDNRAEALSRMSANFTINHGLMTATDVQYAIPGATVLLNGVYSMDGKLFEFKGHVRTEATASQMVGGWKGFLLKPIDKFLEKNGAGVQLPIEISGTEGDVHFGLALHGTDETPGQMLADVRGKEHAKREMAEARREAAKADAEDAKAAHAASVAEAERAHNAAVRHRAEAQNKLAAAQKATASQSN